MLKDSQKGRAQGARGRQAAKPATLAHNLNGQKLGRKGRDTRERIIAATQELLNGTQTEPLSLSAVARRVPLGISSLYLYFSDLTELLLAVLEPVMDTAEDAYMGRLRQRWPNDQLRHHCVEFVRAYYGFWDRHSAILHLRNQMADRKDMRMIQERTRAARPLMRLIVEQMGHDPEVPDTPALCMATVLYTGLERLVTVVTDTEYLSTLDDGVMMPIENYIQSEGRLLELAIREYRALI